MTGSLIREEITLIGVSGGGGFSNTQELHDMQHKEAMTAKKWEQWEQAVREELERFKEHGVFEVVNIKDLTKGVKMLTSTWTMKMK